MATRSSMFARRLVRGALLGALDSNRKEAANVGLVDSGAHHIIQTRTFKKALWKAISPEVVAAVQAGQIKSYHFRRLNWGNEMTDEDVERVCDEYDWPIVAMKHNKKGEIITEMLTPNFEQRDKALDKLYKLMGEYAAEKHEIVRPLEESTDEELMTIISQNEQLNAEEVVIAQPLANNEPLNTP